MHQKTDDTGITEYHLCSECKYKISVPVDHKLRKWELACKEKRVEVNPSGGITRCPIWKEEPKK